MSFQDWNGRVIFICVLIKWTSSVTDILDYSSRVEFPIAELWNFSLRLRESYQSLNIEYEVVSFLFFML